MSEDGVLGPLADRYAHWLGLDATQVVRDREEAAQDIRAMQLVLRMERADPPSWHRALAAAATGAAACRREHAAALSQTQRTLASYHAPRR